MIPRLQGTGFCIVNEMLHVTLPTVKAAEVSCELILNKVNVIFGTQCPI